MESTQAYLKWRKKYFVKGASSSFLTEVHLSSDLSSDEKLLFSARAFINRGELIAALGKLNKRFEAPLLEGERQSLLGTVYGHLCDWHQSELNFISARYHFKEINFRSGLFLATHNQAVLYSKQGQIKKAMETFQEAFLFAESENEFGLSLRQTAILSARTESPQEAEQNLNRLLHFHFEDPVERYISLVVAGEILNRIGKFRQAKAVLSSAKRLRIPRLEPRLRFEYECARFLLGEIARINSPSPEDHSMEEYYLLRTVLHSLQTGKFSDALSAWASLQKSQPEIFAPHFRIHSPFEQNTAFAKILEIHLRPQSLPIPSLNLMTDKPAALVRLLASEVRFWSPSSLIENIWGIYTPQHEDRLYKLIERTRKLGFLIQKQNGAYFLTVADEPGIVPQENYLEPEQSQ